MRLHTVALASLTRQPQFGGKGLARHHRGVERAVMHRLVVRSHLNLPGGHVGRHAEGYAHLALPIGAQVVAEVGRFGKGAAHGLVDVVVGRRVGRESAVGLDAGLGEICKCAAVRRLVERTSAEILKRIVAVDT